MADENENENKPPEQGQATNRGGGILPPQSQTEQSQTQPTEEEEKQEEQNDEQISVDNEANSLRVDDEAYVGTSTEYRNDAYGKASPKFSEDEDLAEVEYASKDAELETANLAQNVGFRGYAPTLVHPSERKNVADEALRNRARIDEEARQEVRTSTDDDES